MRRKDRDGLHQRKAGIYYFRYLSTDGRLANKSTGTDDYQKARKFRHDFIEQLQSGRLPNDMADWRLDAALKEWLSYRKQTQQLAEKTIKTDEELSRPLLRMLANKRLSEITIWDIRRYQAARRARAKARTVNAELRPLIQVLKQARLWARLEPDYKCLREDKSQVSEKMRRQGRALTPEEEERLWREAIRNPRWTFIYHVAILASNTGLRGQEIKTLQLQDVDLAREDKAGNSTPQLYVGRPAKTPSSERIVPLNRDAALATGFLLGRAARLGCRLGEHFILPADMSKHTKVHDPLRGMRGYDISRHQKSWRTAWRCLRKKAGLPSLRFHDLRHHFVSNMAECGIDLEVVRAIVGHMTTEMTRWYLEIRDTRKAEAVKVLEKRNPYSVGNLADLEAGRVV